MNCNRYPWQLKKSKSWGRFWSYQLSSTANSAYPPRKWAKWAELAVLISWQLQNSPQDFDYSFELISIETYAPQFIVHDKFFLGSVTHVLKLYFISYLHVGRILSKFLETPLLLSIQWGIQF